MSTFTDQLAAFQRKLDRRLNDVFVGTAVAVKRSIVDGSPITEAPGQPVGQYGPGYHPGKVGGTLKNSWKLEFETKTSALIFTGGVPYAKNIEHLIGKYGPISIRSTIGGGHSVKMTVAAFGRLVESEVAKVAGGGG